MKAFLAAFFLLSLAALPQTVVINGAGSSSSSSAARPSVRRYGFIVDSGTANISSGTSLTSTGTVTHIAGDASTNTAYTKLDTGTGATASSALSDANTLWLVPTGSNLYFEARVSNPTCCTLQRVWLGISDQSITTLSGTDTPAGNWLGFRASTTASDTNYQCGGASSGTAAFQNTGVVADANNHTFAIQMNDTANTATCLIDGVSVATIPAANIPSRTANMKSFVVVNNTTAAASRTMHVISIYTEITPL